MISKFQNEEKKRNFVEKNYKREKQNKNILLKISSTLWTFEEKNAA